MKNIQRQFNIFDHVCLGIDKLLRSATPQQAIEYQRANPADKIPEAILTDEERQHSAGLMRVNHVGEVCAQALYQGQAMTARLADTRQAMQQAAAEERDHLRWCDTRLQELNSHTSYLNPLWYAGALTIGAVAGVIGDKWSLSFLKETEHQVVMHLKTHLQELSPNDTKSLAIIQQMARDEAEHAAMAEQAGAVELPPVVKSLMRMSAKVMTTTAYYI